MRMGWLQAKAKRVTLHSVIQSMGILPVLILICIGFSLMTPNFLTESNIMNIVRQSSINTVLAAGMTFVIITGGIDLSVGSILGTTAVMAMVTSLDPTLGALSIPVALMGGLIMGTLNGVMVAYIGLPPFIATLGTYTALRGATIYWRTAPLSSITISVLNGLVTPISALSHG